MGTGSKMNGSGVAIDIMSRCVVRVRHDREVYLIEEKAGFTQHTYVSLLIRVRDVLAQELVDRYGSEVCQALTTLILKQP